MVCNFKTFSIQILVGLCCLSSGYLWAAFDIGAHFSHGDAWRENMDAFQKRANGEAGQALRSQGLQFSRGGVFDLLSARNEGVCCIAPHMNQNGKKLTLVDFLGYDLYDAEVRYSKKGLPLYMSAYIYDRGDATSQQYQAGMMGYDDFTQKVNEIKKKISDLTSKKPVTRSADNAKLNIKRTFFIWNATEVTYILDVNYTQTGGDKRVEYIKIIMGSKKQADDLIEKYIKTPPKINPKILKKKLQKKSGDYLLPYLPMVNQGQKGYCTAATTARVLQYYGRSMGMHDVAQVANTTSENGTDTNSWFQNMTKVSQDLDIKIIAINEFSVTKSLNDYVGRYNEIAKRKGKPVVNIGNVRNVTDIFAQMDPKIRKESRNAADLKRIFIDNIKKNIMMGIPVIWSVELGLPGGEEEGTTPQAKGGHTRLIIGFNERKKIIYFSDSWGNKHEKKSISYENAIYITTGFYVMYPTSSFSE